MPALGWKTEIEQLKNVSYWAFEREMETWKETLAQTWCFIVSSNSDALWNVCFHRNGCWFHKFFSTLPPQRLRRGRLLTASGLLCLWIGVQHQWLVQILAQLCCHPNLPLAGTLLVLIYLILLILCDQQQHPNTSPEWRRKLCFAASDNAQQPVLQL